ncbi:MAG: T9SS C-terminal target domain-containing protein, partial [Calditrichaeota bacterium]
PNPFNQSTIISYQLPRKSHVTLELYNISGQKVSTLFAEEQEMGRHHYTWDADDWAGGVYFCRLVADEFMQTKKLMILK